MQSKSSLGLAISALGVALGMLIVRHPESLRAPLWVALTAAGAFVAAGVAMVGEGSGLRLLRNFALLGLLLAMFAPALWVSFGPGTRACHGGVGAGGAWVDRWNVSEFACRGGFAIGAALLALMLVVFLVGWARDKSH